MTDTTGGTSFDPGQSVERSTFTKVNDDDFLRNPRYKYKHSVAITSVRCLCGGVR